MAVYPNPSTYTYQLPSSIRNVHSIEIMSFQLCNADGVINDSNKVFTLNVDGVSSEVQLSADDLYTETDLVTRLRDALALADARFGASNALFINADRRLVLQIDVPFSLRISESFSRVFGFRGESSSGFGRGAGTCTATYDGTHYILRGTKMPEPWGEPYMLLFLNDYERNYGITVQAQSSYMAIPLENKPQYTRFIMTNDEKEHKGRYLLNGDTITNFKIRFTRPDGSLYDFKGIDHQMVVRVTKGDQRNYLT